MLPVPFPKGLPLEKFVKMEKARRLQSSAWCRVYAGDRVLKVAQRVNGGCAGMTTSRGNMEREEL